MCPNECHSGKIHVKDLLGVYGIFNPQLAVISSVF